MIRKLKWPSAGRLSQVFIVGRSIAGARATKSDATAMSPRSLTALPLLLASIAKIGDPLPLAAFESGFPPPQVMVVKDATHALRGRAWDKVYSRRPQMKLG